MGRQMNYTSTPDVPGRDIEEGLGVGTGSLVQSKHVAKVIRPNKNGQTDTDSSRSKCHPGFDRTYSEGDGERLT